MLTGISQAAKLVEALHAQEIPFRTRPELLLVDEGKLRRKHWVNRRWLVFVHRRDRGRAVEVVERRGGGQTEHALPLLYVTGPLCMKPGHAFEIAPCSWCQSGHDWIAEANVYASMQAHIDLPELLEDTL